MIAQNLEESHREIVHSVDTGTVLEDHEQATVDQSRAHSFRKSLGKDGFEARG